MVIELVAGMVIGFGIGFGLDFLLGTKPFLMVLFILLGFVAGVKTMIRSAKEIQEKTIAAVAAREDERD
jgi:ATP synthase protein I